MKPSFLDLWCNVMRITLVVLAAIGAVWWLGHTGHYWIVSVIVFLVTTAYGTLMGYVADS